MRKTIIIILIFLLFMSIPAIADESTAVVFNDVPADHWAFRAIHTLRSLKITDGIDGNRFGLGLTINRAEFVTFLVRLMQWDLISPAEGSFSDNQDTGRWYFRYIETALAHGVIQRDSERFRPEEPVTREEMAVMIIRSLGYDTLAGQLADLPGPFSDVTENRGYIIMAKDFGIINGVGNGIFKPYDSAKREEAAAMMIRMVERLKRPVRELHGFYAIRSAGQIGFIQSLDSAGFGWSRLEYDAGSGQVILNLTSKNNNEYSFPDSFTIPLQEADRHNTSKLLNVIVREDTVQDPEIGSPIPLVEYVIKSPQVRRQVIDSISLAVEETTINGETASFDGAIIDFEYLTAPSKQAFNTFLTEMKEALARNGKKLYVAVHPLWKPGQSGYDGYDFRTVGELADKVILMAHDYYARELTENEMQSGFTATPLTPFEYIYHALKAITDETTGVQDKEKILVQFSFDSVQWKLKDGKVVKSAPDHPAYEAIHRRHMMDGTEIHYSARYQNPCALFHDSADQTDNVLWYEDSRSIQAKINLAKMFGIRGISLWRLGNIPDFEQTYNKDYLDIWQTILQNAGR